MFLHSQDSIALSEASLHSVYASLNAPVVQIDELPAVGPARAAIVVYAEQYGDLGLVVGLRALDGGETALFRYRLSIEPDAVGRALEDALTFAEGLGFLFDDNMLAAESSVGRREALTYWSALMGDGAGISAYADASASGVDICAPEALGMTPMEDLLDPAEDLLPSDTSTNATGELLLDDLIALDDEASIPLETDSAETALSDAFLDDAAIGSPPQPALTKFRSPAEAVGVGSTTNAKPPGRAAAVPVEPAPLTLDETEVDESLRDDDSPGGRALGRIPIVRLRQGGDGSRSSFVSRLLASF